MPQQPSSLQERDAELDALGLAVDAARRGTGRLVVIEGPGGIGKSTLLGRAADVAERAGFATLRARAGELEQGFAFGLGRQLLEPAITRLPPAGRDRLLSGAAAHAAPLVDPSHAGVTPAPAAADDFSRLHGLYWLCAGLAADQPLALVVDDLQWADEPSLRLLAFLAPRLADVPILLAAATRPRGEASRPVLDAFLADPAATTIRPAPLSTRAVAAVLEEQLGVAAEEPFVAACHEATAGNPFLVHALVHEVAAEHVEPVAGAADRVAALGPRELARVILLRLGRLPAGAAELARAVAVLGDGAGHREAAQLAGLDPSSDASEPLRALLAAELLTDQDGLRFAHPLVRAAIYDDLDPLERERRHAAAAALRHEHGAPATAVAVQLLQAAPISDPWAVHALRDAAAAAMAVGDAGDAVAFLRRALQDASTDPSVLAELAQAEARAGAPEAPARLEAVLEQQTEPEPIARTALALSGLLTYGGRAVQATQVLERTAARLDDAPPPVRESIELSLVAAGYLSLSARAQVADRIAALADPGTVPETPLQALKLAALALDGALTPRPFDEVADQARRVLAFPIPPDPTAGGNPTLMAGIALAFAERLDEADAVFNAALTHARRAGVLVAITLLSSLRSLVSYRRGALLEAETDAATALELAATVRGTATLTLNALATAIHTGLDRAADDATLQRYATAAPDDPEPDAPPASQLMVARARLALERGDAEEALRRYEACDRPGVGWGASSPTVIPWRSGVALALQRLDREPARAAKLADEEIALARACGAGRALGMALRARALAGPAKLRLGRLDEAEAVLERAGAPLERARTLCDLGAAHRAAGARTAAREALRDAHELAVGCAATALIERAREELAAAGARPRTVSGPGASDLTPSERRVAGMAAEGATNREIAQALFLSEKTVENHLTRAYAKLGVRRRRDLPAALAAAA